MKKFTLGVFFDVNIKSGGNFQESLNNIILCNNLISKEIDIKIITTTPENVEFLKKLNIKSHLYCPSILSKIWQDLRSFSPNKIYRLIKFFNKKNNFEKFLEKLNIDLIYFCTQSLYVNYIESLNFIFTVFDLAHQDYPEFPEVSNFRIFNEREIAFKKNLQRAVAVLSESELGKKNLILKYNLEKNRVYVSPLGLRENFSLTKKINNVASKKKNLNIKKKYNLKFDYIFYPAQFWAHKNHIYILKALKILEKEEKINLGAIFSGSDQGNLSYIKYMTKKMNLEHRVRFAGFVANEELPLLYSQSIALVMPTYFGPTNIPPLEAFKFNVPVLYSNLPGLREQVGKAALLLDLNEPKSLVYNLKKLINSKTLKNYLKTQGQLRLKQLSSKQNNSNNIKKIIKNFQIIRDCWK
jgi:glycosyltransferase involved in cell wall biosynthesis